MTGDVHRPRILHLIASSASGGATVNVLRFLLRSSLANIVIIQRDEDANFRRLESAAEAVYDVPIRRLSPASLRRVLSIARRERVDLVHTHGKGAGLYGRLAAFLLGLPAVHTYRGYHNRFGGFAGWLYRRLERFLSLITARAIAVSPSERDKILADGVIAPDKLLVLFNPVELADSAPAAAPLDPGRHNIVSIARISPQKDLFTLLDVARALGPPYDLHVFGGVNSSDEAYAAAVRDYQREHAIDNLRFHGDVPSAGSLIRHYAVFLSTARWEGLPTAVVEAFLSRVPVVGTRCIGNVDMIVPGETGVLCEPGDAPALAEAVRALVADPVRRRRLVEGAAAFAERMFDVARLVAQQEEIYRQVLAGER